MGLRLDDLIKRFGDVTAFEVRALVIESGEFFSVVGPAGSGKSSLLNVIAGRETASQGTVTAGEQVLTDLAPADRGVALVPATSTLDPGTQPFSLFDDPLARLEGSVRASTRDELKRVHGRLGTTFVYATDNQEDALILSDRIVVLKDGKVQQVGTPTAVLTHPANTFVASFFGSPPMNLVPGILEKDGVAVEIGPRSIQLNGVVEEEFARDVFLGVRPEHVRVRPGVSDGWRGTVTAVDSGGAQTTITVKVDMGVFVACRDEAYEFEVGDPVLMTLPVQHLHVFDDRGGRLDVV